MSENENYNPDDIMELIERSSLGTPAAKAIRARCPLWLRDQVLARVREFETAGIPQLRGQAQGTRRAAAGSSRPGQDALENHRAAGVGNGLAVHLATSRRRARPANDPAASPGSR